MQSLLAMRYACGTHLNARSNACVMLMLPTIIQNTAKIACGKQKWHARERAVAMQMCMLVLVIS